jgi:hypothetical protein
MGVPGVHVGQLRGVEFGELPDLAGTRPWALIPVIAIGLEPGKALVDVGNEARLAHFAVINDVDAKVGLFADDIRYRLAHAGVKCRIVDLLTLETREAHGVKLRRARQAADMGREDSICAVFHGVPDFIWRHEFYAC